MVAQKGQEYLMRACDGVDAERPNSAKPLVADGGTAWQPARARQSVRLYVFNWAEARTRLPSCKTELVLVKLENHLVLMMQPGGC